MARRMAAANYAEILEFYQNVRRRHILAQGGESLKQIVAQELELWDSRVRPGGYGSDTRKSSSQARRSED
jgi:hypothetical protein